MNRFSCLYQCMFALLFLSMPAQAQTSAEGIDTHDYISMTNSLRAAGVEPTHVDWASIQPLCMGISQEKQKEAYHRCLYDKALSGTLYKDDSEACEQIARADYPDSLLTSSTQVSASQTGSTSSTTTLTVAPLTQADLQAKRRAGFSRCMSGKGWRDPFNAARGRNS